MRPELSPQVFAILASLIEERTGIHYKPDDRGLLGDKLIGRLAEAGFDSFLDYYYFLRYDPAGYAEMDALIDSIVVGETYLFREYDQLKFLVDDVLVPMVAAGRRPRVWSAACATGEEPFTVALMLQRRGVLGAVDLVASDISQRALERARSGILPRRSLRQPPPIDVGQSWTELPGGSLAISPDIRDAIQWHRINLLDRASVAALGAFDVILCRNVLIYFDDPTARQVLAILSSAVVP
ncbi:MAG TPA: protein-glutamate O-methyltransferase CheR, partial [Kofleriaceae bacterium]|nr:protein-glutamate O-methyltransferase CheR [Kofleriaceae bacterium]